GTIRAPFNGVITKRWVDRGATVGTTSMPLLTVMRTDTVRVILDVPERDVPFVHAPGKPSPGIPGNRVVLFVPALEAVDTKGFEGEVKLRAAALAPATRTMRTEVHLQNDHHYLRPQMTGSASIIIGERKDVLTVPSSALVRSADQIVVYYLADLTG